jgi:hypothetical protein
LSEVQRAEERWALKRKPFRVSSIFIFSIGILLGLSLTAAAVWGDIEAHWFDATLSRLREVRLTTLRCPVMITANETGIVSAAFKNPLDRPVELKIRTHVSQYLTLMREENSSLHLEPGKTQKLRWKVTSDDVLYEHLILVKVLQLHRNSFPMRLGSCGILVVDLPFLTGNQIVALTLTCSLLGMIGGLVLWIASNRPIIERKLRKARAMGMMAIGVVVGLAASLPGWWMAGLLALAINILLIGAILGDSLSLSPSK